MTSRSLIDS